MSQQTDISIVIPCYNEEGHILDSVKEIYEVMNRTSYSFEMIFVDDASADKTKEVIKEIEKRFPNVRHLFLEKNRGRGHAFRSGAEIASGKYIGHIDIDLEVSPTYLPEVFSELEKGNDVVLIKRKVKFSMNPYTLFRDWAGKMHRYVVRSLLKIPHTDVQSGCKFFKREILFSLLDTAKSDGWFLDVELIVSAIRRNCRVKQVPGYYIRNNRKRSTVKLFRDGTQRIKDLLRFRKEISE